VTKSFIFSMLNMQGCDFR